MYKPRIADQIIQNKLKVFNAINIIGPKGCGKTTTAEVKCKTVVKFQNEDERANLLMIANTMPSKLLQQEKPILFDEWQDAPKIWGAIRTDCDNNKEDVGSYYLTGSSSANVDTPHTGTLRIATCRMYPMSLYETGESNGTVSIIDLFDNKSSFNGCVSQLSLDDLIYAICRGGWPRCLITDDKEAKLMVAQELFEQTFNVDISKVDGARRNPLWAKAILQSYARNICTTADSKTIYEDVKINASMSEVTYFDYVAALEKLYIVEDIEAWNPSIRSKTAMRTGKKRNFVDPSLAVAALGVGPKYFDKDFNTLGFLFESLCIRDLKVYSSPNGGTISYYRDRYGLEADAVLHLKDGRYALIEFKLGEYGVEEGARHLCEIESLIKAANESSKGSSIRLPDLKLVITASKYGYKREDGVYVIPIGCLKD
ncbi:MAG: DUF4143 domain-containing protein [Bacilli bacterium]|nr:DUF4143 domain-containing protein [Bacilli bacterium]